MDSRKNWLITIIEKATYKIYRYAVRFNPDIFYGTDTVRYYREPENERLILKELLNLDSKDFTIASIDDGISGISEIEDKYLTNKEE